MIQPSESLIGQQAVGCGGGGRAYQRRPRARVIMPLVNTLSS